jgi:hypothetical protein
MFAVDWLRRGITVERETSVLTSVADVVATVRAKADAVAARHRGKEPDGFRLIDATGSTVCVFKVREWRR